MNDIRTEAELARLNGRINEAVEALAAAEGEVTRWETMFASESDRWVRRNLEGADYRRRAAQRRFNEAVVNLRKFRDRNGL